MRWFYLVTLLVVVAIIVAFVLENHENMTVKLFNRSLSAPQSLFCLVIYLLGMWSGASVVGFLKRAYHHATAQEQKTASQAPSPRQRPRVRRRLSTANRACVLSPAQTFG